MLDFVLNMTYNGRNMNNGGDKVDKTIELTDKQKNDIKEMTDILVILPNAEREILKTAAQAFKARMVMDDKPEKVS